MAHLHVHSYFTLANDECLPDTSFTHITTQSQTRAQPALRHAIDHPTQSKRASSAKAKLRRAASIPCHLQSTSNLSASAHSAHTTSSFIREQPPLCTAHLPPVTQFEEYSHSPRHLIKEERRGTRPGQSLLVRTFVHLALDFHTALGRVGAWARAYGIHIASQERVFGSGAHARIHSQDCSPAPTVHPRFILAHSPTHPARFNVGARDHLRRQY